MSQHILDDKSRSDLRNLHELRGKVLVAQVSETRRFALYLRIVVDLMVQLESARLWRSMDHVLTYSGREIAAESLKTSRITSQKTCSQVSETHRFALYLRTGVDLMFQLESSWNGRSVDHVSPYSGRQIVVGSQKTSRITWKKTCCAKIFMNYEAKDLLPSESNTSVRVVFANRSGFDVPIGVVLEWEERGSRIMVRSQKPSRITRQKTCCAIDMGWKKRGSCINIFPMTNRGRILETFTNYEAKDLLRNESNTSVRVVFANQSRFEAPIAVDMAWEASGSCINIFRMTNRGRISEAFTNYEANDLLRNESNTSVHVVFANRSGFDTPIGVVLAWEKRGSCLNIFRMTNHIRISETFTNYEAKDLLLKSVDHVLTYSGHIIAVGSQKPSRITRAKTCCASESNTSVRVVFANQSGFDAPTGVFLAWEERGSCLNIFQTTNCGRISDTFTNYEAKDLLRKSVDHVLTYSGRQIAVVSQKPSRTTREKTCCASESNTSVRVVFANCSGFDAPIAVVMAWEERVSCLNIFRTKNRGRISETFMNYEVKDLLHKSVDHVLTYSERQIAVRYQKASRITRQKNCCASELNTSVRVVLVNQSGFNAPFGVVLAWEERGSCLNIFRMTNRGRISETFTNYEAKDLLRN
ncbi:uncharacterized protein G2W53_014363 [Senna tora]|uniref:Uncharacterized protein n=1 Tax=Senna tora TaxID=362788 RepID=A0A834WTD6_9FABA|nr:uncharacterized protein G2W53_014363 [Senna tora]